MMLGSDIVIIDPENEYQKLSDAVGGSYIRLSLNSDTRINPFDLPRVIDTDEADDALRANLVTLHGLLRQMLGGSQTTAGGQIMQTKYKSNGASENVYRWFALVPAGANNYVNIDDGIYSRTGNSTLFFLALDKPANEAWELGKKS